MPVKVRYPLARPDANKRCAVSCMGKTLRAINKVLLHIPIEPKLHFMCNAKHVISLLGGPARVAKEFGFSIQRVSNWGARGIPPAVIVDHPAFARALRDAGYERNGRRLPGE